MVNKLSKPSTGLGTLYRLSLLHGEYCPGVTGKEIEENLSKMMKL